MHGVAARGGRYKYKADPNETPSAILLAFTLVRKAAVVLESGWT